MDKVQHFEIPAENISRAENFYKSIFGWKIDKAGEMPYWMVHTVETDKKMMPKEAGVINGGMYERDHPSGKNPVIVITVRDVSDSCRKIEKIGGKVVYKPNKMGDMGIYARVKDTEGNVIGLWQNLKA